MKTTTSKLFLVIILLLTFFLEACQGSRLPSDRQEATQVDSAAQTIEALLAQNQENSLKQTLDAMARATQDAFTTAVAIDQMTQAAVQPANPVEPTFTSGPAVIAETETQQPAPTEILDTPEPLSTSTPTVTPTASPCFKILDSWCLSHEGCSTMRILNKTGSPATIRLHNLPKGKIDKTFEVPDGTCTMMLQPGRYHYDFYYCNKQDSGWHALNDMWYIQFTCP
jgi:hypothetical protein